VDTTEPKDVAKAIVEATFACGEEGNGLIYDLTVEADRSVSREEFLETERRGGCRPRDVPEDLQVSEVMRRGDFIGYRFKPAISDDDADYLPEGLADEDGDGAGSLTVVETENGWRFATREGHL